MRKEVAPKARVLARKLAKELTAEDLKAIQGCGTSFYGTGGCDGAGRGADARAGDCVDGPDTFVC